MHETRASTLTMIANVIGCGMSAMWPLMFAKTLCDEWGFAISCATAIFAALSSLWIMTRIDNKELFSVIVMGHGVISMTAIYPMVIGSIIINGIAGLAGINLMDPFAGRKYEVVFSSVVGIAYSLCSITVIVAIYHVMHFIIGRCRGGDKSVRRRLS